jgi:hypothetical protein
MSRMTEVSRTEERHLAVASATLGPWRRATAIGGLGVGGTLALGALGGHFGLGALAGALSTGLTLFFLVGGVGAVLGQSSGQDQRIRRWARSHPWHVAAVPAAAMFVSDFLLREVLTSSGFFGSLWDGLWSAAFVGGVVGTVGAFFSRKRRG